MSASMLGASPRASRRTLVKGAAWTVPALTIAAAAPVLAASHDGSRAGLFVQIIGDNGGVGISHASTRNPMYPEEDFNWSDANKVASGLLTANGEGVFTPGGTIGTGSDVAGTGFWISVPMNANDTAIADGQVILKKGAQFALDYQIQLSFAATANRLADPAKAVDIDGQPRIMQNWSAATGITSVNNGSTTTRASTSAVAMAYKRESYTYNMDGYDGSQTNPVMNFTYRYTTNADVVLKASGGKLYTQLLFSAPPIRAMFNSITAMAVRVRPISGMVQETVNRSTNSKSLLAIPGVEETTSVMAHPSTSVPAGFPNWSVSGATWAS